MSPHVLSCPRCCAPTCAGFLRRLTCAGARAFRCIVSARSPPSARPPLPRHCHIPEIPIWAASRAPCDSAFPMSCGAMRAVREALAAHRDVTETLQIPFQA